MASLFFSFLFSASMLYPQYQHNPKAPVQFFPDWTNGVVVLETNDTVSCILRYNRLVPEGLLQVLDGDNVLTLSVRDVKSFWFFDTGKNGSRKFFTLAVPTEGSVTREMFMEFVYGNDEISILSHRTMGLAHDYMEFTPFKQPVPVTRHYLMNVATGQLLSLSEENALALLGAKNDIARFVEAKNIRFKKLSDYVQVFEYARSL